MTMPKPEERREPVHLPQIRRLVPALAPLLFAVACAPVLERHTNVSDGKAAWEITCGEVKTACFMRADQLCPKGYTTVEESGQIGGYSGLMTLVTIAEPNPVDPRTRIVVVCEAGKGFKYEAR